MVYNLLFMLFFSFGTASTRPPPASPVEPSSGDLWQRASTPAFPAGDQQKFCKLNFYCFCGGVLKPMLM